MTEIAKIYSTHITNLLIENKNRRPYFVTSTFCHSESLRPRSFQDVIWHAFARYDHVYRHLTSRLMTNFSKKPFLHPTTFDFVDMPNTRVSRKLNFYNPVTPHIHSIYLVHEDTLERFEALRNGAFQVVVSHPALHFVQTIDARLIEPSTLTKVISYAAKLLDNREAVKLAGDVPLFTQYPKARSERAAGIMQNHRSLQSPVTGNKELWRVP